MQKSRETITPRSYVTCLPGISTVREKSFASLGIETLGELIHHFPRASQNRQNIKLLVDADGNTPVFTPRSKMCFTFSHRTRSTLENLTSSERAGICPVS